MEKSQELNILEMLQKITEERRMSQSKQLLLQHLGNADFKFVDGFAITSKLMYELIKDAIDEGLSNDEILQAVIRLIHLFDEVLYEIMGSTDDEGDDNE